MKKVDLQNNILQFVEADDKEIGVELYFIFKNEDEFTVVKPALEMTTLEPNLKESLIKKLNYFCIEQDPEESTFKVTQLDDPEASDLRCVYTAKRKEIPTANKLYKLITDKSQIENFDTKEHMLIKVWGIVTKLASSEFKLYSFKKNYPVNAIKKKQSMYMQRGELKLLEEEVLKLSDKIDFIYLDENLVIFDKRDFEVHFDYNRAVAGKANENLDILTDTGLFTDVSKIFDLVDKGKQLKRVLKISADNPVFQKSASEITNFARQYNLHISLNETEDKIDLKSQKEAISMLKILNDDYLISELTGTKYDSKGKEKV